MLMQLRRFEDDILLANNCKAFSAFRWQNTKKTLTTITGVTVSNGKISVMERWWDATFEFASDDPINTQARYDAMCYDANNDKYFKFYDIDGTVYKCWIPVQPVEVSREDFPTAHVFQAKVTFKQFGFIR